MLSKAEILKNRENRIKLQSHIETIEPMIKEHYKHAKKIYKTVFNPINKTIGFGLIGISKKEIEKDNFIEKNCELCGLEIFKLYDIYSSDGSDYSGFELKVKE